MFHLFNMVICIAMSNYQTVREMIKCVGPLLPPLGSLDDRRWTSGDMIWESMNLRNMIHKWRFPKSWESPQIIIFSGRIFHYKPSSYWGPPFKDSPKCPYPCAVAHSEGLPSRCASNLVFLVISVLGSKGQMGNGSKPIINQPFGGDFYHLFTIYLDSIYSCFMT